MKCHLPASVPGPVWFTLHIKAPKSGPTVRTLGECGPERVMRVVAWWRLLRPAPVHRDTALAHHVDGALDGGNDLKRATKTLHNYI